GPGFPAAYLPRAFERFSRADGARGAPGAGLGLALVDAIVRAHGGSAVARNRGGGGAEVVLALPARHDVAHRRLISTP
ncbi:MAG TPA: sensor histidine kinase, partial [Gaiellaceae bacterium]|nr:sensor histidine kinase [Gaiellaceae bacterium]